MFDTTRCAEILAGDAAHMNDGQLVDHVLATLALLERAQAAALAAIAELDHRGLHGADGAINSGAWLTGHADLSRRDGRALAAASSSINNATKVAVALAAGQLNVGRAKALADARNRRTAELFDAHEAELIHLAQGLTVDDTIRLARRWQLQADTDGPHPGDDNQSARLSQTYDGRWRLDANLNPESGAIIDSVLNQIMDDLYRSDEAQGATPPPYSRRRADALVEMALRATAAGDDKSPTRPLIVITVDLADLTNPHGTAVTDTAIPVAGPTLRQWLCDADISRVVTNGPSQVLDVGRDQRTATTAQRRALLIRDRHCVFPGCDRPPGWCQAHHITWWDNGGPTNLDNLCLLCSRHHHDIHRGRFHLRRNADGRLHFTRPDGTTLEQPWPYAHAQ